MSRWPVEQLGKHCEKIGSGATPKGGKESYLDSGPYTLIRSQNVYNNGFKKKGLAFIDDEQAARLAGVEVKADDILLNITGDSIARCCLVDNSVLPARVNQHVSIIRPKNQSYDHRYLRYFLVSPSQQDTMLAFASSGATRNALTKGMIEDFKVPMPPIQIQQEIGRILGTLDEKIELNQQMNETLESMARALFKSWFMDFDPVHAKAQGRNPKGMDAATAALFPAAFNADGLPEGWSLQKVSDVLELSYGKALKKEERVVGNVPVYGSGGITGLHNEALVKGPGIIVGRKGTVGSLYWEKCDFYPIDTVFYVMPNEGYSLEYAYNLLQTLGLETMNTDAAVPGLNRNNVYRLGVVKTSPEIIAAFTKAVSIWQGLIDNNLKESLTLAALRNALLPKLISGELRIDVVDRNAG